MTKDLVVRGNAALPALQMDEAELLGVLRTSLYPGAQDDSIRMVLGYCKASGLDPMQKPVHIVPMWDKHSKSMRDVIMPGIGLYRTQAARTGQLAGISEPEFGDDMEGDFGGVQVDFPEWAKVTVKRILPGGSIAEFSAVEYWEENYATAGKDTKAPNAMWKKRPRGQLAKCAQAQALRMAFPEMTGSQPTADEMEGKHYADEDLPARAPDLKKEAGLPAWPDADFEKRLPGWAKAIKDGKTPEGVIQFAETKGTLSDAQKQRIRDLAKPADDGVTDVQPKVTFAQVADKLNKAQSLEALAEAASLIAAVKEDQRAELSAMYDKRAEDLQ